MDNKKILELQKMTPAELLKAVRESKINQTKNIVTHDEYEHYISNLWREIFPDADMDVHTNFFSLGGTSLQAVLMLSKFKAKYDIEFDLVELFKATTIEAQAQLVKGRLTNNSQKTAEFDYQKDLQLVEQLVLNNPKPFTNDIHSILLTGASGFLGVHLLKECLVQTHAEIFCIIRSSSKDEAKARLMHCAKEKKINISTAEEKRIHCLCGDISRQKLGLSDDDYAYVTHSMDLIIHSAAVVNFVYPYENLRDANVLSLYELIKVASVGKIKPLHFVSTIGVFNSQFDKQVEIYENMGLPAEAPTNGYFQTKWVCEKMCEIGIQKGLPISVYRPSGITINTKSQVMSDDDLTFLFMKLSMKIGGFVNLNSIVDVVPVDFVARSIVDLCVNHPSESNKYHLVSGEELSPKDLINKLPKSQSIKLLSAEDYIKKAMQIIAETNDIHLKNLAPLFISNFLSKNMMANIPVFKSTTTQKLTKIEIPHIRNTLLLIIYKLAHMKQ
ncbi:thioester reductase domain-containing protein [Legionella cardiaca]|uniref:Thioester reductase domain-containing protein n=1 Tax=Legionella cardiaca TaxID=1071983 RepID=A0ABY8ANB1_9GAMM|nr:thioester reductase domain-containing protein [Legionella cardiaca]WED42135.1 thioester reductase domain-containing protein [Legionella cardiaca]